MSDLIAASAIEGWMSGPELEWLAARAAEHKLIVEVGAYKGRSTRALADNTPGVVISIDDFHGPREIDVPRDGIYEEFRRNTASCLNLITLVQSHRKPVAVSPDMVFIDGSHAYKDVLSDIQHWLMKLRPGGLICGHDYGGEWTGVKKAVDEVFSDAKRGPDSIWIGR